MPTLTAFKSLTNKSHSGEPKGTMRDTPALGFQYRYSVLAVFDQTALGFGFSTQTAKLRVQIVTADEQTVLFDSTLEIKYTLVTLDMGGLTLFTWSVDMQNAKVTTTVPAEFTTLASEQPYAIPGGGSDYTDKDCLVQFDLYSGVYEIPLPAGAIFKVKFHNAGMAGLTFVPVQTAVIPGADGFTFACEPVGILRAIIPPAASSGSLTHSYSFDGGRSFTARAMTGGLSGPSQTKDASNTLWLCGKLAQFGWVLRHSETDGLAWSPDMLIWENNYTDAKIQAASDGTLVSVARLGGTLWCRTSLDGFCSTAKVGAAPNPMELTVDRFGQAVFASDGKQSTFQSFDCGRSWLLLAGSVV